MIRILYPDSAGIMQTIVLMDLEPVHDLEATPVDHPVEEGADLTDHIRLELRPFSCRCLITDSLIEAAESGMGSAVEQAISVPLPGGGALTVLGFSEQPQVVQNTYNELKALIQSRRVCTIVTNLERYESMAIKRLSFPETSSDGIEMTLEAREIRVVATTMSTNPIPRQVRGRRRVEAGPQSTTPAPTAPPRPRRESVLHALLGD